MAYPICSHPWSIIAMTILFQLSVFALIVLSFLLVIGVPVVLASPDGWSTSRNTVFSGASLWIG
jgi:photosystem II PsbZ protein